ncbi:MAG: hypothetical protein AAFU67_11465, partial [Bacteroidota bacterium]
TITHGNTGFTINTGGSTPPQTHVSLYDQVRNELKDIDGFAELFGPQNFCQCDHCKSIFSPAAYFVDMMYFIERNVEFLPGGEAAYDESVPISLKRRRPDLWCLELSCDCTYEMIPYLEIMNGVKEHYIKYANGWGTVSDDDCKTISDYDVYEEFAKEGNHSAFFYGPINEPFYEVNILLKHFGLSLFDIDQVNGGLEFLEVFSYLEMPMAELQSSRFPFRRFGKSSAFDSMPVPEFLKHAKIRRRELEQVLESTFVRALGGMRIVKTEFDPGIQYGTEEITEITKARLARTHYFIRLWKKLPWTIRELDLVFLKLHKDVPATGSDDPYEIEHINRIVHLLQIQEQLKISVEELIAIVDAIPTVSIASKERKDPLTQELYEEQTPGFLQRRFDLKRILGDGNTTATLDFAAEGFTHYLAGANLSREDFFLLHNWLRAGDETITLNRNVPESFTFYYRHALLASKLKMSLKDWKQYLQVILPEEQQGLVDASIAELFELVQQAKKWKSSPFSFADLQLLTLDYPYDVETIIQALRVEKSKLFSGDILRAIDNDVFTEQEVGNILQAMVAANLASEREEGYELSPQYNWTQLATVIDSTIWSTHAEAIKEAFGPYHSLSPVSQLYFAPTSFTEIGDIGETEAAVLLNKLLAGGFIVSTPDADFYRLTNTYSLLALEAVISDLTTADLLETNNTPEEAAVAIEAVRSR